jgi:heptosyltransferase-2/heptosyltransferase-3
MNTTLVPLVCRLGALGDMVAWTPALKYLAEQSGYPCDVVAAGAWSYELFAHLPFVGKVHVLKSRNTPYWLNPDKRHLVKALKQRGVGPCWVFGNSSHIKPLLKRSGFTEQDIIMPLISGESVIHVGDEWLQLAGQYPTGQHLNSNRSTWAMSDDHSVNWELAVSEDESRDAEHWLESRKLTEDNFVVMQIGNKKTMRAGDPQRASNTKFWPVKRWAEVARHIAEQHNMPVILIGTPQESALIDEVVSLVKSPLVTAAHQDVGIRRLAAILHLAHSCISVDTGPAHMAAAVNCPVLVLFGEADPARHRPRSAQSTVRCLSGEIASLPTKELATQQTAWASWHGMSGIHTETVLAEWEDYFLKQ